MSEQKSFETADTDDLPITDMQSASAVRTTKQAQQKLPGVTVKQENEPVRSKNQLCCRLNRSD